MRNHKTQMMKQAVYHTYGGPEVIQLTEQKMPEVKAGEILIRVEAATVAATDSIFRQGQVMSARLFTGLKAPSRAVLGSEFAGQVVALGEGVTRFNVGDSVFGPTPEGFGAHSEYILAKATDPLALIPDNLTLREAAALPSGGLTALPFMQDIAQLKAGQNILIIGASGSVGSFALQIAKALGAHVTGVCSTANLEWVKALGADEVIDYTQQDIYAQGTYDVIFDSVGKSDYPSSKKALKRGGQYVTTVLSAPILWQQFWTAKIGLFRARFAATGMRSPSQKQADLNALISLVNQGLLKVKIDRVYAFAEIQEAHQYVDQGHKKGNVVVNITSDTCQNLTPSTSCPVQHQGAKV